MELCAPTKSLTSKAIVTKKLESANPGYVEKKITHRNFRRPRLPICTEQCHYSRSKCHCSDTESFFFSCRRHDQRGGIGHLGSIKRWRLWSSWIQPYCEP